MKFNPIRGLIDRHFLNKDTGDVVNILTSPTHASYEYNLCMSLPQINFYAYRHKGSDIIPHWNPIRPIPLNYHLLDENGGDHVIPDVPMHAVLCQNFAAQHQHLFRYAQLMKVPYIGLFHTMSPWGAHPQQIAQYRQIPFDATIFITDVSKHAWGFGDDPNAHVIYHMMHLEEFKPLGLARQPYVMTMGNDASSRGELGFGISLDLVKGLPHKHFGTDKNSQLHNPINGHKAINQELNQCGIYLNTCVWSPLPMSLLESAAAGCPIVTINSCGVADVFTHKENCLMFPESKPEIGRQHLEFLLNNPAECERLGKNARKLAEDFFAPKRFAEQWENLIWKTIKSV